MVSEPDAADAVAGADPDLIRNSAPFRKQTSLNGFYQDNGDDADLLRLRLDLASQLYPQISGHKAASPSASCRWTASMVSCRNALILNWLVAKETLCQKRLSLTAQPAVKRRLERAKPVSPFCSKRCQLIDLGEWAAEEKRIPSSGDLSDSDDWSEPQQ